MFESLEGSMLLLAKQFNNMIRVQEENQWIERGKRKKHEMNKKGNSSFYSFKYCQNVTSLIVEEMAMHPPSKM